MEEVERTFKLPSFGSEFTSHSVKQPISCATNGIQAYDNGDWKPVYPYPQISHQSLYGEPLSNRYQDYVPSAVTNGLQYHHPPPSLSSGGDRTHVHVKLRQKLLDKQSGNCSSQGSIYQHSSLVESTNSFPPSGSPLALPSFSQVPHNPKYDLYLSNSYPSTPMPIPSASDKLKQHYNHVSTANHLIPPNSYFPQTSVTHVQDQCYTTTDSFENQSRLNGYATVTNPGNHISQSEDKKYILSYHNNFNDFKQYSHPSADYMNQSPYGIIHSHIPNSYNDSHIAIPFSHHQNGALSMGEIQNTSTIRNSSIPITTHSSVSSYNSVSDAINSVKWNSDASVPISCYSHSPIKTPNDVVVNSALNNTIYSSSNSSAFSEKVATNAVSSIKNCQPNAARSTHVIVDRRSSPERNAPMGGESWTSPQIAFNSALSKHVETKQCTSSALPSTPVLKPNIISYGPSSWQLSSPSGVNHINDTHINHNKIPSFHSTFSKQSDYPPNNVVSKQYESSYQIQSPHQFRSPICPTPVRAPLPSPTKLETSSSSPNMSPRNNFRSPGRPPTTFFPSKCLTPSSEASSGVSPNQQSVNSSAQSSKLNEEQRRLERLRTNGKMEPKPCDCVCNDDTSLDRVQYYDHLGSGQSIAALRELFEKRWSVNGVELRFEKIIYTGKEGKTSQGCPIAKWVIRRGGPEEKYLVVVKQREGHHCNSTWIVVVIVAWEGVVQPEADDLYEMLVHKLTKFGLATQRRCGLNEQRTCACQGTDSETCGASFSFGCSWSMYYNGCKYARSKTPRKFRLSEESEEAEVETKLQLLATKLSPLYKMIAPASYNNQVEFEHLGLECRLGNEPGKPWTGVTACVDFCAHAHKDLHNMNNGCTVVATLTKHRGYKKPDDEQLHVLPLYILDNSDEYGSKTAQEEKVKNGSVEFLTKYPMTLRLRNMPLESCRKRAKLAKEKKNQKGQNNDFISRTNGSLTIDNTRQPNFMKGVNPKCKRALFKDDSQFKGAPNTARQDPLTFDYSSFLPPNFNANDPSKFSMMFPNLQAAQEDNEDLGMQSAEVQRFSKQVPNQTNANTLKQIHSPVEQQNIKLEPLELVNSPMHNHIALSNDAHLRMKDSGYIKQELTEKSCHRVERSSTENSLNVNCISNENSKSEIIGNLESSQTFNNSSNLNLSITSQQIDVISEKEDPTTINYPCSARIKIENEEKSSAVSENASNGVSFKPYIDNKSDNRFISGSITNSQSLDVNADDDHRTIPNSCHLFSKPNPSSNCETATLSDPTVQSNQSASSSITTSALETHNSYYGNYLSSNLSTKRPPHLASSVMNTCPSLFTKDVNSNPSFLVPHQEVPLADLLSDIVNYFKPEDRGVPPRPLFGNSPAGGSPNFPVYPSSNVGYPTAENDSESFYEVYSDNEDNFSDNSIGGVAIALAHGSVLFECAKNELHATTALKNPNRYEPKRISLVFYQHKNMNYRNHGMGEYEKKIELKKNEEALAEYNFKDEINNDSWQNESLSSLRKKRKMNLQESQLLKSPVANYSQCGSVDSAIPPPQSFVPQTSLQNGPRLHMNSLDSAAVRPASGETWHGFPYPPPLVMPGPYQ